MAASVSVRGGGVTVHDVLDAPVGDGHSDASETLADWVAGASTKLEGSPALVSVGRGDCEIRPLELPPVPEDELPAMVRLQAIRSFASAGERSVVDYLVTDRGDDGTHVLAATIDAKRLAAINAAVVGAGLEVAAVVPRVGESIVALAVVAALSESESAGIPLGERVNVAMIVVGDEVDLAVIDGGGVKSLRTIRHGGSMTALAGEIRRSAAAAGRADVAGLADVGSTEKITASGLSQEQLRELGERLDVEIVDVETKVEGVKAPFPDVTLAAAARDDLRPAADPLGGRSPMAIDFAAPRRPPDPPSRRGQYLAMAAGAAAVVAGLFLAVRSQLNGIEREAALYAGQVEQLRPVVADANLALAETEAVEQFLDGDVRWLDELKRLAEGMPPADQVVITDIRGTTDPRTGGTLVFAGAAAGPAVVDELASSLSDADHVVRVGSVSRVDRGDDYPWQFNQSVTIAPASVRRDRDAALDAAAEPAAASTDAGPFDAPEDAS